MVTPVDMYTLYIMFSCTTSMYILCFNYVCLYVNVSEYM